MSRLALTSLLLALVATGCHQDERTSQASTFQKGENARKPVVAVYPVIDNTKTELAWNLSDELSSGIYYHLSQSDDIHLLSPSQVRQSAKKLQDAQNPFGADLSWIKKAFAKDEFVAFLELVEHEEVIKRDKKKESDPQTGSADLKMSMRVRVFDLRGAQPVVILQEMVQTSHFVPRQFTQAHFYQTSWGSNDFNISPVGLAHAKFTKDVATRVEDYIVLASCQ